MKPEDITYGTFALIREMLETTEVVRNFDFKQTMNIAEELRSVDKLLLTGEGSSRIFPAKNAVRKALTMGLDLAVFTDGSHQSELYDLSKFAVFCSSNSGQTKEVILLAQKLAATGNERRYAVTAKKDTPLQEACKETFVLHCGPEQAVAATKSVVEQALIYESILWHLKGIDLGARLPSLASALEQTLTMPISREIVEWAVKAPTIYFAGYNDGVAEELALKTNEITHKKSDFLEGTYVAHGIEEVMDKRDIVFWIDPIESEMEKFQEVLVEGVGLHVVAIADRETPFPTILVPSAGVLNPYVYLCAGWNLLVEIGLATGIDIDKPTRARKIGNVFIG